MNFYEDLKNEMEELEENGLLVTIRTLETAQGAWLNVDGKKVLNLKKLLQKNDQDASELKKFSQAFYLFSIPLNLSSLQTYLGIEMNQSI